ncbi:MAG: DUF2345 domain-containing protein, partial [Sulfuriferula sp.]|nr:DUF2345 domain-containing protein [Sulfuriferula sp.]
EQAVTVAAPQHLLLTSGGAYIKLEGGNIEVHGPGVMAFKGSLTELAGPGRSTVPELRFPTLIDDTPKNFSQRINFSGLIGRDVDTGQLHERLPYEGYNEKGELIAKGVLTEEGLTKPIYTAQAEKIKVVLGDGDWRKFSDVSHKV